MVQQRLIAEDEVVAKPDLATVCSEPDAIAAFDAGYPSAAHFWYTLTVLIGWLPSLSTRSAQSSPIPPMG